MFYKLSDNIENLILTSYKQGQKSVIDGKDVVVYGAPNRWELDYRQGDQDTNHQGTCGLVAVTNFLTQLGKNVTEEEIVDYAVKNDLCVTDKESSDTTSRGGTITAERNKILNDYRVMTRIYTDSNIKWICSEA